MVNLPKLPDTLNLYVSPLNNCIVGFSSSSPNTHALLFTPLLTTNSLWWSSGISNIGDPVPLFNILYIIENDELTSLIIDELNSFSGKVGSSSDI